MYCANNPIKFIDLRGDSLTIKGKQSDDAMNQLQAKSSNSMTLSKDDNSNISYTINTDKNGKPMRLKGDTRRLAEIIDNKEINVNVATRENDKTSTNHEMIGGAFMGSSVIKDANGNTIKIITNQEVNPIILDRGDVITGKTGQLMMHEVTEAFEGGKIVRASGIGIKPATIADRNNSNSVYRKAHGKATSQPNIEEIRIGTTTHGTPMNQYLIKGRAFFTTPIF